MYLSKPSYVAWLLHALTFVDLLLYENNAEIDSSVRSDRITFAGKSISACQLHHSFIITRFVAIEI